MTCEGCDNEAEHKEWERRAKEIYLPQYEAERRMGYLYHCPDCVKDARGWLAAEQCQLCPPGRHRLCEYHV